MSKVRSDISISLDGFAAGPNQSEENPLGEGGEQLHDWAIPLKAWRESHGYEGGEVNASSAVLKETLENIGARIMGRKMFGGGPGAWNEDDPWTGWWGDDPPYHTPVFVLTHHPREPLEMAGGTTFHFVTDGVDSALDQAREAAGEKDVHVPGGAQAIQQCLAAGAIEELELHVVPLLLGGGERLLDNLDGAELGFEQVRVVEAPGVTHVKYRVSERRVLGVH
jgi:dihydrofolate reductase